MKPSLHHVKKKFDKCTYLKLASMSHAWVYILCKVRGHKLITWNMRICTQPLIDPWLNKIFICLRLNLFSCFISFLNLDLRYTLNVLSYMVVTFSFWNFLRFCFKWNMKKPSDAEGNTSLIAFLILLWRFEIIMKFEGIQWHYEVLLKFKSITDHSSHRQI